MKRVLVFALIASLIMGLLCMPAFAATADSTLLVPVHDLTVKQLVLDTETPQGGVDLFFKVDKMPLPEADGTIAGNVWIEFERKVGGGSWTEFFHNPTDSFGDGPEYHTQDVWNSDEFKNQSLSYRARMVIYDESWNVMHATDWSNIATVGIKASSWAAPEIEKAVTYGLVPASISGDYTTPITREEFAELATKLYEVYTGQKATAAADGTFTDCTNPEVLKASQLGIVNGVGGGKFDPKALTNREQIAAMLNRAVKVIAPTADLSTAGAPSFGDASSIAPYFLENVKFMSKNGFIKGSNGNFEPKGTCTREMAVLIAVRLYENYKK